MAYIKINKDNFHYNLTQLTKKVNNLKEISVVLKDNAYGHGLEIIARLASEYGITQAVVISTKEAIQIEKYFNNVLILDDVPFDHKRFSFAITSMNVLKSLENNINIELKVDTGMHRNGIMLDELDEALRIIKYRNLKLVGVMTHHKSADSLSSEFFWQEKIFDKVKKIVLTQGFKNIRFHSHNSAATLRNHSFNGDMARVGIAIYGYNELPNILNSITLKPVLSLWAKKISSRILKKGQRVGYTGSYIAKKDMCISTYDLGYGDGWMRDSTSKPYILPNGLEILGRVSMDFISIESEEKELCIMENAQRAASHFNTISYEITTILSADITRFVV